MMLWLSCTALLALSLCHSVTGHRYGIVIDAGSSGSRARVYTWHKPARGKALPDFIELDNKKEKPGLSSIKPDNVATYLQPLITFTKENIPEEDWKYSPIYVLATAGMRLLMEDKAEEVIEAVQNALADPKVSPFYFRKSHARILSGEEEGVFAWISANYLDGFFDQQKTDKNRISTGIIEMGGASTQIAFIPAGSILANKYPVTIANRYYSLYVHSYLSYGQELIQERVKKYVYGNTSSQGQETTLNDPCMLTGDTTQMNISGDDVIFKGSSDPQECLDILDKLVPLAPPVDCSPKPCAIGTVYQPTLPENKHFFALSAYVNTLNVLQVTDDDGTFSPNEATDKAMEYCNMTLDEAKDKYNEGEKYLSADCMMGLYIPLLLTKAYRFDKATRYIQAKKKINGVSAEWTLGAIIYKHELLPVNLKPKPKPKVENNAQKTTPLCRKLLFALTIFVIIACRF